MDWLKANNKKATFFITGSYINGGPDITGAITLGHPEILKRAADEGHELGIHTWSHRDLTSLTTDEIISEFQYTANLIKQVTGKTPRYIRPPFGGIDDRVRAIAKAMRLKIVMWNWDSR